MKSITVIALVLVICGIAIGYTKQLWVPQIVNFLVKPKPTPEVLKDDVHVERCGGNTLSAHICGAGYHCQPDPNSKEPFNEVGGICVEN